MGNIYLVGFMATGKTAVGRILARKMKWHFLDLDDLIELRYKGTISDIFAKEGEIYFRRIERRTLREISKEKKFVVACGGGIVLGKENIEVIKQTGKMICLTASPEIILKRTQGYSHRPLLNVADQRERIEALLKFRQPFYAQADYIIDTSDSSVEEVARKITQLKMFGNLKINSRR